MSRRLRVRYELAKRMIHGSLRAEASSHVRVKHHRPILQRETPYRAGAAGLTDTNTVALAVRAEVLAACT